MRILKRRKKKISTEKKERPPVTMREVYERMDRATIIAKIKRKHPFYPYLTKQTKDELIDYLMQRQWWPQHESEFAVVIDA